MTNQSQQLPIMPLRQTTILSWSEIQNKDNEGVYNTHEKEKMRTITMQAIECDVR
jgi:hypothetical protein